MGTNPAPNRVAVLGATLCVLALVSLVAAFMPIDWLRPLGTLVRRADDVTPERFERFQQLGVFFAVALSVIGGALLRFRRHLPTALPDWRSALRSLPDAAGRSVRRGGWPLLTISMLGAGLRLGSLNQPMAYDESYSFINLASQPWYIGIADFNVPNNHLLNTFLMHWSFRVFGPEPWALRLPVLVAGILLIPAVWCWADRMLGRGAAHLASTFTAVSPGLISYSTDARGYMLITLAAVMLDHACGGIEQARRRGIAGVDGVTNGLQPHGTECAADNAPGANGRAWIVAWLAVVLGCWSVPTMIYAIGGSALWLSVAVVKTDNRAALRPFAGMAMSAAWLAVTVIVVLYSPAYIMRGLVAFDNNVMSAVSLSDLLRTTVVSWQDGFDWWTTGLIPAPLQFVGAVAGWMLLPTGMRWRLAAPFMAVLAINLVQRFSPPPRVFLFLAPWCYLLAGYGLLLVIQKVPGSGRLLCRVGTGMAVALIAVAGIWWQIGQSVPFNSEERTSYVSIPDVVRRIDAEMNREPNRRYRLIAPLPCDLPSIYYMDRSGFRIPVNGVPEAGETVWLICRLGESPVDVLHSDLVSLSDVEDGFMSWEPVAGFETLRLYRSQYVGRAR